MNRAYYVTRTHPHDRRPRGLATIQAIVAGPFGAEEDARARSRDLDRETRAQGVLWQETTGLPMPWTNGTVAFVVLSTEEIVQGKRLGIEYPVDPNPYPALPELDDWERGHSVGEIRRNRSYVESVGDPSWCRFFSADRRFPISLEIRSRWSRFYDFNREESLLLDLGDWAVVRVDLRLRADRDPGAREILSNPGRLIDVVARRSDGTKKLSALPVGDRGVTFPRLRWRDGSETVLCLGTDGGLWHISRPASGEDPIFLRMLASVRWLDDDFFRDLDRRLARW